MTFIDANGTRLYFRIDGSGRRTFLLLNGLGGTTRLWGEFAEGLCELGRVVRFDFRGSGETELPAAAFTLETLAADAYALLDHVGFERPVVVGHAFGGRVAQVFARDYPSRLSALVVCGTGGHFPGRKSNARYDLGDRTLTREQFEEAWLAQWCAAGFRERQPDRAVGLLEDAWADRSRPTKVGMQRAAAAATPSGSYWGLATVPTLLLYGEEDTQGTAENALDLDSRLADSRLVFIPDAAHMAIRERPELLLAEIQRFLEERDL